MQNTWALFASLFMIMLGSGLQSSILSIRGVDEGFSTTTIGLILTAYYLGYMCGSFTCPLFIKRVGYVRVFAALVAFASIAVLVYAMFVNQYAWFVMRFLTGFCYAGIYVITESWLNHQTNNSNRGQVLAIYVIILYLGMFGGQFFINLGSTNGYALFVASSIIISLSSIPLLLTARPSPEITNMGRMSLFTLYKRSPLGFVSAFLANFSGGVLTAMSATYAKSIGMSNLHLSYFVGAAYVGCILFQFPIGKMSDGMDRRKVIIFVTLLASIVAFFASQLTNLWVQISVFALFGGLLLPLYALCVAYVNDRLDPSEILSATSALVIVAGLGASFGPLTAGFFMDKIGSDAFFYTIIAANIIIVVFGIYRTFVSDKISSEERTEFAPMAMASTQASMVFAYEDQQLELDFGEQYRRPKAEKIEDE